MCLKGERCGGKHTIVFLHWLVTMYEVYRAALWTESSQGRLASLVLFFRGGLRHARGYWQVYTGIGP